MKTRAVLRCLCVSAVAACDLQAQEVAGSVQGRVVDADGRAVAEAQVAVSGPHLLGTRTTLTDREGFFRVEALPPGTCVVRINRIGFRPVAVEQVGIDIGRATTLGTIVLTGQVRQLEELRVVAPSMTLDPVHTTVGGSFDATDYAALPVERDYKSSINMLPHVNTSYYGDAVNTGGSTGLENMYYIDGVNVTSTRTARSGTSLPWNFVRAVEVKVGSYEAQYGRALGALVNAETYTGTNRFEADFFGFMTNTALAARPRAEPNLRERGSLSFDVGGRVGGPLVRDRLWYSAAYNPRIEHVDKEIPAHGVFEDRRTAHIYAGKLNWRTASRASVELSVFGDPTERHAVDVPSQSPQGAIVLNPDPYLSKRRSGGQVGSLRASVDVGARLHLEGAFSRSSGRESNVARTTAGATQSQYLDEVSPAMGGGIRLEETVHEGRTAMSLRASMAWQRHSVTIGTEYENARASLVLRTPGLGFIKRNDIAVFLVDSEYAEGTFHNRLPTAYVQDSWRVTDRLAVNAGVRWSDQALTGASGRTAQRLGGEWQPRLGFVWRPGRPGRQRVFGSYGRFYQQEPLNLPSLWYLCFAYFLTTYAADPRQPGAPVLKREDWSTCEDDVPRLVDGVRAEFFDEFALAYERLVGSKMRVTVRGMHRALGSSWQFGAGTSPPCYCVIGTPGEGDFAFLPRPRREYTALELGVERATSKSRYRGSYVLSRTWGNYTGLFGSDAGSANPGGNLAFFSPDQAVNSSGLLPGDRTHVVKAVGTYYPGSGATVGAFFTWQSGTPINSFGPGSALDTRTPVFLVPRGSAGRTPGIWDLSLRVAYDPPWTRTHTRFIVDLLHVGNPRETVQVDQYLFRAPTAQNRFYLTPVRFQPPMAARLGLEVTF